MVVRRNTNRLAGHSLRLEGAPYAMGDDYLGHPTAVAVNGSNGFARCSCGAHSEILPSNAGRKQWHRDHKDEVRRQQETAS